MKYDNGKQKGVGGGGKPIQLSAKQSSQLNKPTLPFNLFAYLQATCRSRWRIFATRTAQYNPIFALLLALDGASLQLARRSIIQYSPCCWHCACAGIRVAAERPLSGLPRPTPRLPPALPYYAVLIVFEGIPLIAPPSI